MRKARWIEMDVEMSDRLRRRIFAEVEHRYNTFTVVVAVAVVVRNSGRNEMLVFVPKSIHSKDILVSWTVKRRLVRKEH
jgi:hypothetical protein